MSLINLKLIKLFFVPITITISGTYVLSSFLFSSEVTKTDEKQIIDDDYSDDSEIIAQENSPLKSFELLNQHKKQDISISSYSLSSSPGFIYEAPVLDNSSTSFLQIPIGSYSINKKDLDDLLLKNKRNQYISIDLSVQIDSSHIFAAQINPVLVSIPVKLNFTSSLINLFSQTNIFKEVASLKIPSIFGFSKIYLKVSDDKKNNKYKLEFYSDPTINQISNIHNKKIPRNSLLKIQTHQTKITHLYLDALSQGDSFDVLSAIINEDDNKRIYEKVKFTDDSINKTIIPCVIKYGSLESINSNGTSASASGTADDCFANPSQNNNINYNILNEKSNASGKINIFSSKTSNESQDDSSKLKQHLNSYPEIKKIIEHKENYKDDFDSNFVIESKTKTNAQKSPTKIEKSFSLKIDKNDWQKLLVTKSSSINLLNDSHYRTLLSSSIPLKISLFDVNSGKIYAEKFNWQTVLRTSSFINLNSVETVSKNISFSELLFVEDNKIDGHFNLSTTYSLDKNFNLIIKVSVGVVDFYNSSNNFVYFSASIEDDPKLVAKYFLDQTSSQKLCELIGDSKLNDRPVRVIETMEGDKRQQKNFKNISISSTDKDIETQGWWNNTNILKSFGIVKTATNEDKWTTISFDKSDNVKKLDIKISALDRAGIPLIVKSKHETKTLQSIFWNDTFAKNDSGTRNILTFDGEKYSKQLKDKNFSDINHMSSDQTITVDLDLIEGTSSETYTWIPIRLVVQLNKDKKYDDQECSLSHIFGYSRNKDEDFKKSIGCNPSACCSSIQGTWNQSSNNVCVANIFKNEKTSFLFSQFGLFAYKKVENNKTTVYLLNKLWGNSFSKNLPSNSNMDKIYGFQGSIGSQIESVELIKGTQNATASTAAVSASPTICSKDKNVSCQSACSSIKDNCSKCQNK